MLLLCATLKMKGSASPPKPLLSFQTVVWAKACPLSNMRGSLVCSRYSMCCRKQTTSPNSGCGEFKPVMTARCDGSVAISLRCVEYLNSTCIIAGQCAPSVEDAVAGCWRSSLPKEIGLRVNLHSVNSERLASKTYAVILKP